MINICVTGAAGRMGGRIITAVNEADGLQLAGAVERDGHPQIGEDAGVIAGVGALNIAISDNLEQAMQSCDVLIDFTFPEVTLANA
ncbi:MAG: 4-hydroxy-tetrahydrodipicolinate reductase, partial [Desulfuromonadales bacterium]|nr:4-hydroxy-tetrahydrodipicolinate reductase [Desulfuromonadales bacterium]NIS43998.1 4-hydroxy-tetrahydrodipicolinate reductase [Desulfuromonadales bacterium]